MGTSSREEFIKAQEENSNWTTVKCHICNENIQIKYTNWKEQVERDIHTCKDCRETERGHKFH